MKILNEENASKGRYWTEDGDAEMTYSIAGDALIIVDHTYVPETLRGQGVGLALVSRAVADARRDGRKIMPLCPYANTQFRRHKEWHDVLEGAAPKTTSTT